MSKQSEKEVQNNDSNPLPIVDQCFIITPIGEVNSEIYVKAMGLIDAVIKPVLTEFSFIAVAANHVSLPGSINKQLLKSILEDKLVIANLTGLNPNVMYELAVRHAVRLPVVIMAEKGTRLPFDITDQRTIFYEDSLAGLNVAREQLRSMIEVALKEKEPDNPIYQAAEQALIFKSLKVDDPIKLVMERLDLMERRMERRLIPSENDLRRGRRFNDLEIKGIFKEGNGLDDNAKFLYIDEITRSFSGLMLLSMANSNPRKFSFSCDSEETFEAFVERLKIDPIFKLA